MSSILTNSSAMVALQTLKSVNKNLEETQGMISTGKAVATAKDNSSVWAISKVMESDVKGFEGISDSLALGESSVAVAANASETITDLLTDIKGKIVAAQEENVDRDKIQTDIDKLTDQIGSIVGAAQFNGMNLLKGTEDVNILSSLDRSSDGTVTASNITVARQDMSGSAGTYGGGSTSLATNATASAGTVGATGNTADIVSTYVDNTTNYTFSVQGNSVTVAGNTDLATTNGDIAAAINALGLEGITAAGDGTDVTITSTLAFEDVAVTASVAGGTGAITSGAASTVTERAENVALSTSANVNDGDSYRVAIDGTNYDYIAGKGENMEDVAKGLKTAIDSAGVSGISTQVEKDSTTGQWSLKVDNSGADKSFSSTGQDGGTASGGMFGIDSIDVTSDAGASAALSNIETLINNSIDAAAEFGSARSQIETQTDFISSLTDSLKQGIGGMVDADMEETSARLQALQVQQQLATQSLTIANQAPQSILSLFG